MSKTVLGIYYEKNSAEEAISKLINVGYNPKNLSVIMKDADRAREMSEITGVDDVAGTTVAGATTGAVLGGLAGLIGSFIIPGLGALLVGGPIGALISGAATGALAGGVLGALTSLGLSKQDANLYEERINSGGILLAVPSREFEEEEVAAILEEYGADQVKIIGENQARIEEEYYQPAYFNQVSPKRKNLRKNR